MELTPKAAEKLLKKQLQWQLFAYILVLNEFKIAQTSVNLLLETNVITEVEPTMSICKRKLNHLATLNNFG